MLFANILLTIHAIFILIVILAVPLILTGASRKWRWVRLLWFRLAHLAMIAFVALESVIQMNCPLTVWESNFRQDTYGSEGFIVYWLHRLMFYNLPAWVFTVLYLSYAALVASLLYIVPITWNDPNRDKHHIKPPL